MNKYLLGPVVGGMVLALSGCGDSPIDVSLDTAPGMDGFKPVRYIVVTGKVDGVKLNKVTVNRGNCKAYAWRGPNPVQFGQEKRGMLECDLDQVKEVVVETDKGEYTFNF